MFSLCQELDLEDNILEGILDTMSDVSQTGLVS